MELRLGRNERAPAGEAQAELGHDGVRAPDTVDADVFEVAPYLSVRIGDETDRLAAVLARMRQTREYQQLKARMIPPDMPEGLDTHRPYADRATRVAVEAMLNHVATERGLPEDTPAVMEEIRAFIRTDFRRDDPDAEEQKMRALRTLSTERRASTEHVAGEEFWGLSAPENTYYVGAAAHFSKPASEICAALWCAINTLPEKERPGARTQFVCALAEGQQRDFSGEFAHFCAPRQFQNIMIGLQHYFPELINVAPRPKLPHEYVHDLFDFALATYGPHETLPEGAETAMHTRALQIWEHASRAEHELYENGELTRTRMEDRAEELNVGITALLQFYGLTWTRPEEASMPARKRRKSNVSDESVVIRIPSPPRLEPDALMETRGYDPKHVHPEDKATEILLAFKEQHENDPDEPNDDVLNDFYRRAIDEGRELFADRPEMPKYVGHILIALLWEYNFEPQA